MRRILVAAVLVGGCGPGQPQVSADGVASDDSEMSGGGASTDVAGSSTVVDGPTSGTGAGGDTTAVMMPGSGGSGGSDGSSSLFVDPSDVGASAECDLFAQDCPQGFKCAAYADNGGSSWNAAKCVPVAEDPAQLGEACLAEGNGVSGVDDCDVGFMCWDVDPQSSMGTCVQLCAGSPDAPECPEGFVCPVYDDGVLNLCLQGCDPLVEDPCPGGEVCVAPQGPFLCMLDASGDEGQVNDPCMFIDACDAGLYCIESMYASECDQDVSGCCQPLCDVTQPNMCAGAGQACVEFYGEGMAPAGYENVGVCALPM